MNQTVTGVFSLYKEATHEKNVEKFLSFHAEDVHLYDCWGSWEITGMSNWSEVVKEWFSELNDAGEYLQVEFYHTKVEESDTVAFVHSDVLFAAYNEQSREKLRQITNRFTFGMRKTGEYWYITHQHSSLPIDIQNGKGMFNLK